MEAKNRKSGLSLTTTSVPVKTDPPVATVDDWTFESKASAQFCYGVCAFGYWNGKKEVTITNVPQWLSERTTPDQLDRLSNSPHSWVKMMVARMPNARPETVARLKIELNLP